MAWSGTHRRRARLKSTCRNSAPSFVCAGRGCPFCAYGAGPRLSHIGFCVFSFFSRRSRCSIEPCLVRQGLHKVYRHVCLRQASSGQKGLSLHAHRTARSRTTSWPRHGHACRVRTKPTRGMNDRRRDQKSHQGPLDYLFPGRGIIPLQSDWSLPL